MPPEPKRKQGEAAAALDTPAPSDLSEHERAVFGLLSADEPAHIDALAAGCRLPLPELTGALLGLEMRDLIRQLPGKCFVRKLERIR